MKGNEPAFPFQSQTPSGNLNSPDFGITIRDYFAFHASDDDIRDWQSCKPASYISRECARYMFADAMLKERNNS